MAELIVAKTSRRGSIATMLLTLASLGMNVFLAAQLLEPRPSLPSPPVGSGGDPIAQESKSPLPVAAEDSLAETAASNPSSFHWSDIESTDYRQYIANLRAVGCPEQILRDIIQADVNQLYAKRVQAVWQPQIKAYWQKPDSRNAGPNELKQFAAIELEKGALFKDVLGFKPSQQRLIDTLHLQVHGSEQQLLFLPPDKREAALTVLANADFETREMEVRTPGRFSSDAEKKLFDEKVKLFVGVLSPEEIEEFRLRNSPTTQTMSMELEYFNATPEEFKTLFAARELNADGKSVRADLLNRTAATEEARKLFGDERAKEFERVTDMFYLNTRRSAEEQGVPLERIEQAWQVTRDARTAADQAAKNASLSVEERKRQVQALRQEADVQLIGLLGDKASRAVRRDLRVVLGGTEASIGR